MRAKRWKLMATMAALLAPAALGVVTPLRMTAAVASGATAPSWEPDTNAAPPYGNIVFYDAVGNEVTSGTGLDSPFAYAVGTTAADHGATKDSLNFYNPGSNSSSNPSLWTGTPETGSNEFNPASGLPAGTPADLVALAPTYPVNASSAASISSWITLNTPSGGAYDNIIQVRLTDTGPGGKGNAAGTYWETDIGYNTTSSAITVDGTTVPADGWAQLFPLVTSSSTSLSVTPSSPQPQGTSVSLKATVSASDTTGSVLFFDNGTAIGSPVAVSGGTASYSYTPSSGSHSYTASFVPTLGDMTGANTANATIESGSVSSPVPFGITGPSTTTVTSSANPDGVGDSVTYTATVTPVPDSGTVSFNDGSGNPATTTCAGTTVNTSTGKATCTVSYPSTGTFSVTAAFSGSSLLSGSTSTALSQVINTSTTTTVGVSSNPAGVGQSVTYTATVSPIPDGGTVAFDDGTGNPATKACAGVPVDTTTGKATCAVVYKSVAGSPLTVTADYSGDTLYGSSTGSLSPSESISPATTSTGLSTSAGSVSVDQSVTYTATVSPAPDGGTVAFNDGTGNPATENCSSAAVSAVTGEATCTVTYATTVGSPLTVTATYSGNPDYSGSSSISSVTETVSPASTTTGLISNGSPSLTGATVVYTATVTPSPDGGTVKFLDGTSSIGCDAQAISSGKATCSVTYPSAGSHSISAVFSGNSDYLTSTSPALTQTVQNAVAPTAPTGLKATAGDATVVLSWKAPTSDGGSPVEGYNLYVGTSAGDESATPYNSSPISGTTTTVSGLKNGVKYYFVVKAVNAVGPSLGSNEASATPTHTAGYLLVGADGGIFTFGGATFHGSLGGVHLAQPIVGIAWTPDRGGYWLVARDGGVFSFGDAHFHGSLGGVRLAQPIVGIIATHDGGGYWLVAADGGMFSFGDAVFHGSLGGVHLVKPIVAGMATPDGGGYWLVAADGGMFSFGDAVFHGSLGGVHLVKPIVAAKATGDGGGYWLVAADGGIFTFGDAVFHGSLGSVPLVQPIVSIVPTSDAGGYWLAAADGGVFAFGDATYQGSVPATGASVDDVVGAA